MATTWAVNLPREGWVQLATEEMADQVALWVASLADDEIPDGELDLAAFGAWLAADLAEQAADRGLDPAAVAAAIGEHEWREACEAGGFAPVPVGFVA